MSIINRPMKGVECGSNLQDLRYPFIMQPKYDGIRVIFEGGVALSASLKPLRNRALQKLARELPDGLECEYYIPPDEGGIRACASTCNSATDSLPDCGRLYAFDIRHYSLPYMHRLDEVKSCVNQLGDKIDILRAAPSKIVVNSHEVSAMLTQLLDAGFEGGMLKDPDALYKCGRSTLKSQECLKLKPFVDDEAVILSWKAEQENLNEPTVNELGTTSRSSSQLGKRDKPLIGALRVRSPKFSQSFWVSGFTRDLKERLWVERDRLVGQVITYKYQPCLAYDRPRHPIFLRFRPMQS